MRCCARGLISGRTRGICVPCAIDVVPNNAWRRCCREFCGMGKSGISSMVFHAPQSGHLPTHLLCSPPHCWQMYFVRVFGIRKYRKCGRVECDMSHSTRPHFLYFLMPKTRTKYICQQCGGEQSKWVGKCPDCG